MAKPLDIMPLQVVSDINTLCRQTAAEHENERGAFPTVTGVQRGPRGRAILSQIGFRDHGPATNGWSWFASLDLKRGRNRNILPHPPLCVIAAPH